MVYNWQLPDWPRFTYGLLGFQDLLLSFAEKTGVVSGLLKGLTEEVQQEATIDFMIDEAVTTSAIEGEYLSRADVRSSLRNQLHLNASLEPVHDKRANGIAELLLVVRKTFSEKLTKEMLCTWHRMLMQVQSNESLIIGDWRKGNEPMQVVSGPLGKQRIHFEAPPSESVPHEMERFFQWFNDTAPGGVREIKPGPVRAAVVHLYFESIHPFDDGNGRIGRALAEKALSQGLGRPVLFSLSKAIDAKKKEYYDALERAQRSNEITKWITYFVTAIVSAQEDAERMIEFVFQKARYFDHYRALLSERQLKVLRRMLNEGPSGFKGGMSASKYAAIAKVSKATATRDLQELLNMGALVSRGGGRSTRYEINF